MNILLADFHKFAGYSGGIEHVLSIFANAMTARGHRVSAAVCDEKEGKIFFPLDPAVHLYNLYRLPGETPHRTPAYMKIIREAVRLFSEKQARIISGRIMTHCAVPGAAAVIRKEQPDVIVSFREPTGVVLLKDLAVQIPVISMLHNDPEEILAHAPETQKQALLKSAAVQVLLPSFIDRAKRYLDYDRFTAIPNIVEPAEQTDLEREKDVYRISCVGRLTGSTKRQHLLVEAFHLLASNFPTWQVDLWGADYDKAYVLTLKGLIVRYGLEHRVHIRGTTADMGSVWADTDIFAFPSHHEGFPLSLTEALSAGIPAVGYRSCPAVNELIRDGSSGFLCDDGAEALAEALRKLMDSRELRIRMGTAGRRDMKAYRPDAVWDQWESLLKETAAAAER